MAKSQEKDEILAVRRDSFARRYGVKLMKKSERTLVRFLNSVRSTTRGKKADPQAIEDLAELARRYQWDWGLFDHGEIWGRDGHPFFLVGHPYGVRGEKLGFLIRLEEAGFYVSIDTGSWYHETTVLVEVCHPSVSAWPSEKVDGHYRTPAGFDARSLMGD